MYLELVHRPSPLNYEKQTSARLYGPAVSWNQDRPWIDFDRTEFEKMFTQTTIDVRGVKMHFVTVDRAIRWFLSRVAGKLVRLAKSNAGLCRALPRFRVRSSRPGDSDLAPPTIHKPLPAIFTMRCRSLEFKRKSWSDTMSAPGFPTLMRRIIETTLNGSC